MIFLNLNYLCLKGLMYGKREGYFIVYEMNQGNLCYRDRRNFFSLTDTEDKLRFKFKKTRPKQFEINVFIQKIFYSHKKIATFFPNSLK